MFRCRKTDQLRTGRISSPGARYFVTACTKERRVYFATQAAARTAIEVMKSIELARDVAWLAGTVMPDHIHVVFELGPRLSLGRVIAKLKGSITRGVHAAANRVAWQENVFEHRLRPEENAEAYAFYVFMNPYCEGLCETESPWPWWICTDPLRFQFLKLRRADGSPQLEWLDEVERVSATIVHGE